MAGRCHGGTGRENNAQPTSPRNSLCDGLWVSASLDIIRLWDPDVHLSCGTFQREQTKLCVFSKVERKLLFFLMMTGNKLMAGTIRRDGGEEQNNVNLFNMSDRQEYHLGTTAEVYCFTMVSCLFFLHLSQYCGGPFFFAERILAEIK